MERNGSPSPPEADADGQIPLVPELPVDAESAQAAFDDPTYSFAVLRWLRWPNGVHCPHCGAGSPGFLSTRNIWKCRERRCRRQFSVRVGTLFEDSPIPVGQWLTVLWLLANRSGGVSSYDLSRTVGVTQKTAWFMLHRVRVALGSPSLPEARSFKRRTEAGEPERFCRFTRRLLLLTKEEFDRELSAAKAGRPIANPFARRSG